MQKGIIITENLVLPKFNLLQDTLDLFNDVKDSGGTVSLRAIIDATHSGRLTNDRVYPGKKMKKAVKSWIEPYAKPVLKSHNDLQDPIGRVIDAKYVALKSGPEWENDYKNPSMLDGSGFIQLTTNILDKDSIEKFIDGRFNTVSTRQMIDNVMCSICGSVLDTNSIWNMLGHEHTSGEKYKVKKDGEKKEAEYLCYFITGDLDYTEVSVVNIPADQYSKISGLQVAKDSRNQTVQSIDFADDKAVVCDSLVLTSNQSNIQLLQKDGKTAVTAADREKLTNKTIIAISPIFKDPTGDNKTMDTNKNSNATANSDVKQEPTQASDADQKKEGVIAPDSTKAGKTESGNSISVQALTASVEVLTNELKATRDAKETLASEVGRAKEALTAKDQEITSLKTRATTLAEDLRKSYSTSLLNAKILLRKPDASQVKDMESYNNLILKISERTIESLKDSLQDISQELVNYAKNNGTNLPLKDMISSDKVENPVANIDKNKTENKKETKSISKEEATTSFLNS
jgi:outer membrane murein-binding lipoprotein Lpp